MTDDSPLSAVRSEQTADALDHRQPSGPRTASTALAQAAQDDGWDVVAEIARYGERGGE